MFHPSRKGIYCDLCGDEVLIECSKEILYYSVNMKRVTARDKIAHEIEDVLDMDFCEKCHKTFHNRVLKVSEENNKKRDQYGRNLNL